VTTYDPHGRTGTHGRTGAPAPPPATAAPQPPPAPPAADPGSTASPASANPPAPPPAPPGAPADPAAAAGTGPGHGLVPPATAPQRSRDGDDGRHRAVAQPNGDATGPLLGADARDRLTARLHHAISGFVDGPHKAVEEADAVFDEAARHLADALARRRRALRQPWQQPAGGGGTGEATEQLRLALREYKEATDRLLKL
jgi:hypothetical protein